MTRQLSVPPDPTAGPSGQGFERPADDALPWMPRSPAEMTRGIPLNVWRQAGKVGWRPRRDEYDTPELTVAGDRCVGCSACVEVCQPGALRLMPGAWAVTADRRRCNGCRRCVSACPFGLVTVSGTARNRHQIVLDNLGAALASTCPEGWRVYSADPTSASALAGAVLMPDLAVVWDERTAEPWPPQNPRTVALVVEVVSPNTRDTDLGHKREVYRAQEVPAYWTVDQRDGQVTVHWSAYPAWFDRWAGFTFG